MHRTATMLRSPRTTRPPWRHVSAALVALAGVVTTACGATAVEPRTLEPMAPLEHDAGSSSSTPSPATTGRSGLAGPAERSDSSDASGVSPDISAALVAASSEMVEHCVEHVKVGAFLGDTALGEWWDSVDGDENTLRDSCREVAATDPWRLEQISDEWRQMQAVLDALPASEGADDDGL